MIVGRGKMAQKLIGDEYDIVGFDPRCVPRPPLHLAPPF